VEARPLDRVKSDYRRGDWRVRAIGKQGFVPGASFLLVSEQSFMAGAGEVEGYLVLLGLFTKE
jgi:hypothetical protein